jgi:tRNA pseudouridine32 synthase/23S rRNA pseudouridine746 synthase
MRTPDLDRSQPEPWPTMGAWLDERLSEFIDVDQLLAEERFLYQSGAPVVGSDGYRPHTFVWFHRDLRDEPVVPGEIAVVHRDDRIVVIDKPPFLSTIPRGRHVQQSVVVRLRSELGLPELSPLHRLDRVTSGLLISATEKRWRAPYQTLFQRGEVRKVYRALADYRAELELPVTVRNHLIKRRGHMQAEILAGEQPNSESLVELERVLDDARAVYRLSPRTGRTHQLRMHMWSLGIPISGDPLYPDVHDVSVDDFAHPLQLLASELSFTDPVDGAPRHFEAVRSLPLVGESD